MLSWFRRRALDEPAAREAARARAEQRLLGHAWPRALLDVVSRLAGERSPAYLVGGTIRDAVLGRPAEPAFDLATELEPEEVTRRFARVEPTGIKHGTVLIVEGELLVECTTFRREGAYPDARHPERVFFTHDPLEDLARRDLTVNALALDPIGRRLLDPHGGALDLERRLLRAVGDPVLRFQEDALRPLRVARFAATLEMDPEEGTRRALASVGERATWVALERVREELVKMMRAPKPSRGFELLREAGLLGLWMPEVQRCYGVPQNRYHAYDVYEHSLYTCDAAPPEKPQVRWAALLHDIGKPDTRVERRGEGTFYNHQFVGAELADRLLERMRFPADERAAIVHLVREHMFDFRAEWSDAGLRRWLRRVGIDAVADLFDLRIADVLGNGLRQGFPTYLEEMRRRIECLLRESRALTVRELAVGGRDVMRVLELPPGREVGAVLEALLEEVLDDPSRNRREYLLDRLARLREQRPQAREGEAPGGDAGS